MKSFKIHAAGCVPVALGALMLASFSASAKPDQPTGDPKPNTTKPNKSDQSTKSNPSKLSDWDRYRMTANRATIGEALAHKALSYRGVRYRMGGTTTNGIDCSGLTQAVYKKWGMLLPRTSTEQFSKGARVLKDQLQPGDLVFFSNTYKHGISHVGIYVGDNKFVHAAGSGRGVIVSSLSEPYHANHYAGSRRIALDKEPEPDAKEVTEQ